METRRSREEGAVPSIERSPSLQEELQKYHQRDLLPSHIYRVGMKIFGKKPLSRKRIINPSMTWKDPPATSIRNSLIKEPSLEKSTLLGSGKGPGTDSNVMSVDMYREWVGRRKEMRNMLDSIGAHEQWLSSKECTPIEAALLEKLRRERIERNRIKPPPTPSETSGTDDEGLSAAELRRMKLLERKRLLEDINRLEKLLKTCRTRIAELVVPYDINRTYLIPSELLLDCLERYIIPPSIPLQSTIKLIEGLEKETGKEDGVVDYRKLFQTGLASIVLHHSLPDTRESSDILVEDSTTSVNSSGYSEGSSDLSSVGTYSDGATSSTVSSDGRTLTTMEGDRGVWSSEFKSDSHKQFVALLEYCQKQGIVLDRKLAKRGLLIPPDKKRQDCLQSLHQPGTDLLSRATLYPPKENEGEETENEIDYCYGWQYQQLRGPTKPKLTKLSTGIMRIKPKIDSWMTFAEFDKLTKEIQSRPGFNYKYHGLPSNSAFWPGALEDKLRLYLPQETSETKPCSINTIYQPVHRHRVLHRSGISVLHTERGLWPVNDSGYVQFGSSLARTKKTYIS